MTTAQRYSYVLDYFSSQGHYDSELVWHNAFELLVAVMLSAQCTDKRVNLVTPRLFAAYPTPHAMALASVDDILQYVSSVSYPNSKAAHLSAMSRRLVSDYGGDVPRDRASLESLPGVGHKTASVMLVVAFGEPAMPVDTHVFRVAERLGLTTGSRGPQDTERQLCKHIPRDMWGDAHHWLLLHGRYVCMARKPQCGACALTAVCRFWKQLQKKHTIL
ncbi:MAG TPA: endonuclease III [Bacteroidales bacterium]|nr:endonuclease III [Bacteroidales bacterium]